ncbi:MAG: ACT domain-containing protein [Solirubrobacteraceae bacterium]
MSFTIAAEDLRAAERALQPIRDELGIGEIDTDPEIGKVSIIGAGMRSHPGVAAQVFETLAEREINIEMISTSPIKISCVIRSEAVPEAVQALHQAFQLGLTEVREERPIGQEAR